jgi:hypothetical protein
LKFQQKLINNRQTYLDLLKVSKENKEKEYQNILDSLLMSDLSKKGEKERKRHGCMWNFFSFVNKNTKARLFRPHTHYHVLIFH